MFQIFTRLLCPGIEYIIIYWEHFCILGEEKFVCNYLLIALMPCSLRESCKRVVMSNEYSAFPVWKLIHCTVEPSFFTCFLPTCPPLKIYIVLYYKYKVINMTKESAETCASELWLNDSSKLRGMPDPTELRKPISLHCAENLFPVIC